MTSTRTVSSAPSDDPYHGFAHAATELADCGEDRLIVGGGSLTSAADSYLNQGYPEGNSAATVRYWRGDAVGDSAFTLTVFAFCSRPSGGDRVEHIRLRSGRPTQILPGASGEALARCRRGERLVSGGARGGGDSEAVWLQSSAPDPEHLRRWVVRAAVQAGAPGAGVTAYAYCARR